MNNPAGEGAEEHDGHVTAHHEAGDDPALSRLIDKVGDQPLVVWAVLCEDTYETSLGDGYYAYIEGAYRSKDEARAAIQRLRDARGKDVQWYNWHLRSYTLTRSGNALEIAPAPSEHEPTTVERLAAAMVPAGLL
jgi:hypothetical protein